MTSNNDGKQQDSYAIILYGAGQRGQEIAQKFRQFHIPAECFCDSDPNKHGKEYFGLKVKSIEEIKSQYKKGEYKLLLSLNEANRAFVKNYLLKNGMFEESDFLKASFEEYVLNAIIRKNNDKGKDAETYLKEVAKHFIQLDGNQESLLKEALIQNVFTDANALNMESGKKNLSANMFGRLELYRTYMIPWLDSIRPLRGARILEIGCGTGSTTVAFCEQGADVCAIDINGNAINAAKERAKIYGLSPEFACLSAVDIKDKFGGGFDFIIYAASIEHMTYHEKISTLKAAYDMLGENQYIVFLDIPNRLWPIDYHTSFEPFYNWLPDSLAIDYAGYTQRERFNTCFTENNEDHSLKLARWGRGISYHEIEVALGRGGWKVESSRNDFLQVPADLFKYILMLYGPEHIDDGFYETELNLAIKKIFT